MQPVRTGCSAARCAPCCEHSASAYRSRVHAQGWATKELPPPGQAPHEPSMAPLLDALIAHVPAPNERSHVDEPFTFLVVMTERRGRLGAGWVGEAAAVC